MVEVFTDTIVITVSVALFADPIPMTFGNTPRGLVKAFAHINKYVTVSPIESSSATHGNLLEVSA
jgi:hypothetical protein